MSARRWRLAEGGRIDRARPLGFSFNGRRYEGYAGDTLASALLASGVHLVGRSFKYHRPRGVMSAGVEETNALVQLGGGARSTPNVLATQLELFEGMAARSINCWPSVERDFGAAAGLVSRLLPAGFYYKTFMWPSGMWMGYEHFIRRAAGLGQAPREPDAERYVRRWEHVDVAVVGAGPAGLAAALAAGRAGARVLLCEQDREPGGALLSEAAEIDGRPALDWVAEAAAELDSMAEVTLLPRTTLFGYHDHNYLTAVERATDHLGADAPAHLPRERLWKVRARQVVLATGAIERPLVFADNDRPGIMLAGAARSYLKRFAARPGRMAVVFANNDGAYRAALELNAGGVAVTALVDPRPAPKGAWSEALEAGGVEHLAGHAVVATHGRKRIQGVEVAPVSPDGREITGRHRFITCDFLANSGGWNPAVHLFSQSGGRLGFDDELACFVPERARQPLRSAGAAKGSFALADCLAEGFAAGTGAAAESGFGDGKPPPTPAASPSPDPAPLACWQLPVARRAAKCFVDFHNDVTAADIALAAREGFVSVEHTKRYTTAGMGTDQGKTGNVNALAILARVRGEAIPAVGTTTFRPPYTPVTFGAIAGPDVGPLFLPERKTPIFPWHQARGAVFEPTGDWRRPRYYRENGEDMAAAVSRECLAVRNAVGITDSSTLGKIDIQGPDSLKLLDWVYTNAWGSLAVERCRYGLMLGEDGMVFDDGVTARLGERHYLMSTTSGGAGRVFDWLEEWLQCEWPHFAVDLTSVTTEWASIALAGPRARQVLAKLEPDFDIGAESLPHMAVAEGRVAGIPARVFRVSFTGELSYEINVPAGHGLALWLALMVAGEPEGITPFGLEALLTLRAEKGYIVDGVDTDGSITPHDLGMDWIVSRKKADFIGKRSLSRSFVAGAGRRQLVGLLTEDPAEVLPPGANVAGELRPKPPMPIAGNVTSSTFSPTLGRSIALALVKDGRSLIGQKVALPLAGKVVRAEVVRPLFYDPEGERLHG